jgi:predicted ABC-type exoprotein transport system permease subunit
VKYGAIAIEYKILNSQDHWSSNIAYIKKLICYGLMSMWLCALNFFPLNYIPWLNEDGIGVKICCHYFGIVVVVLLANSFVKMFDTN